MSTRTWVGTGRRDLYDYNSEDHASLAELARAMRWQLPAKIRGNDAAAILDLLVLLDNQHHMAPSEFWIIQVVGHPEMEYPSWDEIHDYMLAVAKLGDGIGAAVTAHKEAILAYI